MKKLKTVEEIMQELQHYSNEDLMKKSIYELLEMWFVLAGLEEEEDKQYSGLLEEE